MDETNTELSKQGIVEKIEPNESPNPKAPAGFLYLEGDNTKYTIWSKTLLNSLVLKGKYKVVYSNRQSTYNGKTYNNYTVNDIIDENLLVNTDKLTFPSEYIEDIKEKGLNTAELHEGTGELTWNLMEYPIIIDEDVKEIKMPKKIMDYLMELKSMLANQGVEDEYTG